MTVKHQRPDTLCRRPTLPRSRTRGSPRSWFVRRAAVTLGSLTDASTSPTTSSLLRRPPPSLPSTSAATSRPCPAVVSCGTGRSGRSTSLPWRRRTSLWHCWGSIRVSRTARPWCGCCVAGWLTRTWTHRRINVQQRGLIMDDLRTHSTSSAVSSSVRPHTLSTHQVSNQTQQFTIVISFVGYCIKLWCNLDVIFFIFSEPKPKPNVTEADSDVARSDSPYRPTPSPNWSCLHLSRLNPHTSLHPKIYLATQATNKTNPYSSLFSIRLAYVFYS